MLQVLRTDDARWLATPRVHVDEEADTDGDVPFTTQFRVEVGLSSLPVGDEFGDAGDPTLWGPSDSQTWLAFVAHASLASHTLLCAPDARGGAAVARNIAMLTGRFE